MFTACVLYLIWKRCKLIQMLYKVKLNIQDIPFVYQLNEVNWYFAIEQK